MSDKIEKTGNFEGAEKIDGTEKPHTPTPQELADIDERLSRNAKRILDTIIKAIPKLADSLKIKGDKERVSYDIDIAGLDKFSAMILASYIIVKGDKQRTMYFAILQTPLFKRLYQILSNNSELLKALTAKTRNIQFTCPAIDKGFQFKERKKGLFGKELYPEPFNLQAKRP